MPRAGNESMAYAEPGAAYAKPSNSMTVRVGTVIVLMTYQDPEKNQDSAQVLLSPVENAGEASAAEWAGSGADSHRRLSVRRGGRRRRRGWLFAACGGGSWLAASRHPVQLRTVMGGWRAGMPDAPSRAPPETRKPRPITGAEIISRIRHST